MNIKGKIKKIDATIVVNDKFKKREFVVVTNDTYPQEIQIQFTQDKCEILNGYTLGQDVDVSINLRGRMWTDPQGVEKYFNTVEAWRIEKVGEGVSMEALTAPAEDDDLPF